MSIKSIFRSERVAIGFDTDRGVIRANWYGFLKKSELMEGMEHLLNGIRDNSAQLHVSDQTELKALSSELKKYLQNEALKRMEESGLKKVGVIQSDNIFAQASVDTVNRKAELKDLSIQMFPNETECFNWLLENQW